MVIFYGVAVLTAICASIAHILFKLFALSFASLSLGACWDWRLGMGVFLFGTSVVLTIVSLRVIDFSAFYSFTALNYLFISVLSKTFLGENLDREKVLGNTIIVAGILVYNL